MRSLRQLGILSGLAAVSHEAPNPTSHKRAEAIKETYRDSWKVYYENAFPNDTLMPLNNTFLNDRNRWGVTAIDALTTAIVLEDEESVNQILDFVPTIDFTTTAEPGDISLFETNIRFFGGLLSAYDLLSEPRYAKLVRDGSHVGACLDQARSLADSLKFAFDTPTGIPDPVVRLNPDRRRSGATVNNVAEAGTLILEWTRLSDLTGDRQYADLARRAESYLISPKPASAEPWPGLTGTFVSIANGSFTSDGGGWGGYTDSFFEYLIKMYLYDPDDFSPYKDRWVAAAESTMEHLASHPRSRNDLTFLADYEGQVTISRSTHLASFAGGNFILGGILLDEQRYIDFGLAVAESYFETYRSTATGIGPEAFAWTSDETAHRDGDVDVDADAGFWATSPSYILRPETVESLYYSYRVTGDPKYQDMAWEAYRSIDAATGLRSGAHAGLQNVTVQDGGYVDKMESFWLAETLKYLFLTFDVDSEDLQVRGDGGNKWVYNTEAHPVKIRH
ncbi:mannosyl-oligosaccharide alpha-1,2-mannosidase [Geosmithia morbida]|uniref:alpha-1,2-Mannosidase n=1 Tax=Geosmithia morbida TaxID=1094350 RepID=A0A9P5CZY0_9HYPO|nr:mannosyl-oligosaccharide alpha-1,2-mannosidase [Geosmithia morbida]KAF4122118.1 mannosyl-oligosaccharide alpha-1,2-mannosidase [Geosmithia morbida]